MSALGYAIRQEPALTRFIEDGRLSIDNNHSERALRKVAIGRKNWLFAGSLRAGKRAAAIMTASGSNISCTPQPTRRTGFTSMCFVSNLCLLVNEGAIPRVAREAIYDVA